MVPWAPLSSTVLALAPLWRCCGRRHVCFGFARANTEGTSVRLRLRHGGLRAQNEVRAPRPSGSGLAHALSKSAMPLAPLCSTVLALALL